MTTYPVTVQDDDNDTILVLFPDFPEAATFGDTKEEALARAVDALETVIDAYIADRRQIPAPSAITPISWLSRLWPTQRCSSIARCSSSGSPRRSSPGECRSTLHRSTDC